MKNNLKFIRTTFGMSLQDLGDALGGIARQNVARWESGARTITKERLKQLSEIFGITEEYFQKELTKIEKIEIQKLKIRQDIKNSEFEYENSIYDETTGKYVTALQVGYDESLMHIYNLKTEDQKKGHLLNKIGEVIADEQTIDSSYGLLDQMDIMMKLFDRFTDIVASNETPNELLFCIIRAIEMTCPSLKDTHLVWGKGRPEVGTVDNRNKLTQELYQVMSEWKDKHQKKDQKNY